MRYNRELNYQRRKRFLFKVRLFAGLFFLVLVAGSAFGYYMIVTQEKKNTSTTSTSRETSGYFAPTVNIFRSPYFQFQADQTWAEVPTESTATKFVYRSRRSNLIEHDMTIYVNDIPENLASTRVLPVSLNGQSELLPTSVSDHCMKTAGGPTIQTPLVTMGRTKFKCDADATGYTVLVGLIDGTTAITMQRPDGVNAKYSIFYTNLRATPDGNQISQIVDSFQAR